MLSLAKAAKDYHLRKLGETSPGKDYYLRGGTATGIWRGGAAAELGLEGTVTAQGLVRLLDGQHPGTGEQMGRKPTRSTSPPASRPTNNAPTSPTKVTSTPSMASPMRSTAARYGRRKRPRPADTTRRHRSVQPAPTQQRRRCAGRAADHQTPNRTRQNRTATTRP